jgi:hypothetical protein
MQLTKGFASVGLDGITIGSKSLSTVAPADGTLLGFCLKFCSFVFQFIISSRLDVKNAPPNAKPRTLYESYHPNSNSLFSNIFRLTKGIAESLNNHLHKPLLFAKPYCEIRHHHLASCSLAFRPSLYKIHV